MSPTSSLRSSPGSTTPKLPPASSFMPEVRPDSGSMMPRAIRNAIRRPSSTAAPATTSCMVTVLLMRSSVSAVVFLKAFPIDSTTPSSFPIALDGQGVDGLVVKIISEHEVGSGFVERLAVLDDARLDILQRRSKFRRQIGVLKGLDMFEGLFEIGLEGGDTAGCTSRQHPPGSDLHQKDLGLERGRFLGELASIRSLDEFLDVGRQLVTVGEQLARGRQPSDRRLGRGRYASPSAPRRPWQCPRRRHAALRLLSP